MRVVLAGRAIVRGGHLTRSERIGVMASHALAQRVYRPQLIGRKSIEKLTPLVHKKFINKTILFGNLWLNISNS
jgi:hypothetical protein